MFILCDSIIHQSLNTTCRKFAKNDVLWDHSLSRSKGSQFKSLPQTPCALANIHWTFFIYHIDNAMDDFHFFFTIFISNHIAYRACDRYYSTYLCCRTFIWCTNN